jgi:glutaredoxin
MEFSEPSINGFTIYSKSGCFNCSKIKKLLKEHNIVFVEIDCDDYLVENRDNFLSFIQNKTSKSDNTFPIIFNDGNFIGGYAETVEFINKIILSFEDYF